MLKPTIQNSLLYPEIIWQKSPNIYQKKGRVFILGGEKEIKQTVFFCEALYNCGISKISLGFPKTLKKTYGQILPKEIQYPLLSTPQKTLSFKALEDIKKAAENHDLFVIGLGLSSSKETQRLVEKTLMLNVPTLLYELKAPRAPLTIYLLSLKGSEYPLIKAEKLQKELRQTLSALDDQSIIVGQERALITRFKPENAKITLLAATAAIWAENIKKPFESACTASYITKIWQENYQSIKDISKAIKKVEEAIEK